MVTIYENYDDEPEDTFLFLPEELACEFYALEMDSYTADIDFFEPLLPQQGTFLELGCGTGRIADKLAGPAKPEAPGRFVVGIDISIPMLQLALQRQHSSKRSLGYLCMDMTQLAFSIDFDAILIPYNTLNLLGSEDKILQCLTGCKNFLQPGGKLLAQLFIPTEDFIRQKKTFQFQMFDRPGGGKIIKEILKHYDPKTQSVHIEERFRVRPLQGGGAKEDWNKSYTIAGFSADQWLLLFTKAGFTPTNILGDYAGNHYDKSTTSTVLASLTL
ncbi:MAG: class I SAM-dependent methyltransferase [Desulfobulbaceae bacterium]|nr:class I SAM-dependent methyltransferase [Desulfobulbaceae bacterium]